MELIFGVIAEDMMEHGKMTRDPEREPLCGRVLAVNTTVNGKKINVMATESSIGRTGISTMENGRTEDDGEKASSIQLLVKYISKSGQNRTTLTRLTREIYREKKSLFLPLLPLLPLLEIICIDNPDEDLWLSSSIILIAIIIIIAIIATSALRWTIIIMDDLTAIRGKLPS